MQKEQDNSNKQQPSYQQVDISIPVKGMVTDFSPLFQPEGTYTFALNATKASMNGVMNSLSNEESNILIAKYPVTNTNLELEDTISAELPLMLVVTNSGVWNESIEMHDCGCGNPERTWFAYFAFNEELDNLVFHHVDYMQGGQMWTNYSQEPFNHLFNGMDIINMYLNIPENSVFNYLYRYRVERQIPGNKTEFVERSTEIISLDITINNQHYNAGTNVSEFGLLSDNSKSTSAMILQQIVNNSLGIRMTNQVTGEKRTLTARKVKEVSQEWINFAQQAWEASQIE